MQKAQLWQLMPAAPDAWLDALIATAPRWGIITPLREAHYLAQLAHECAQFTRLEENLNYTSLRLTQVWPSRFPTLASAAPYDHEPQRLANFVYANRLGNGPPESGDGWRYRGRGPIQITGRTNYQTAGQSIGVDLEASPEALLQPLVGCHVAGWFWSSRGLNYLADADHILEITRRINGGTESIDARRAWLERAKRILGITYGPVTISSQPQDQIDWTAARDRGLAPGELGSDSTTRFAKVLRMVRGWFRRSRSDTGISEHLTGDPTQ